MYKINHRFKEEVIIPYMGLSNNIQFFCDKGEKQILCSDGTLCDLKFFEEKKLFEFEDDIRRLYNLDAYTFLKKWYGVSKYIDSLWFLRMRLKKL